VISGNLCTRDYLLDGIERTAQWKGLSDKYVQALRTRPSAWLQCRSPRHSSVLPSRRGARGPVDVACFAARLRNQQAGMARNAAPCNERSIVGAEPHPLQRGIQDLRNAVGDLNQFSQRALRAGADRSGQERTDAARRTRSHLLRRNNCSSDRPASASSYDSAGLPQFSITPRTA
jgi:hypothetical protein